MGFVVNPYDQCVFNATVCGVQVSIAFHVDDLLITSISDAALEAVVKGLKKEFIAVTVCEGNRHSYLAMNLELLDNAIVVDMVGYLDKQLADRKLRHFKSPATPSLCADRLESLRLKSKSFTLTSPKSYSSPRELDCSA